MESKDDPRYHSFFDFHRIIWVLHGRLKCTRCDKNFTEIDPRFIQASDRVLGTVVIGMSTPGSGIILVS